MSEEVKLEGVYDLACRLTAQFRAYDLLNNVSCFHKDCGVQYEDMREHAQETLRGIHDTLREFEAECVRRGERRVMDQLRSGIKGQKGDDFIAAVAGQIARSAV